MQQWGSMLVWCLQVSFVTRKLHKLIIFLQCSYKQVMQEMWFQLDLLSSKNSTSSVIAFPLQALSENECLAKSICLSTLKEVMAAKYPQFRGTQQNDAHEFLRHLIGDLHEEMRSKNRSPPEDVFIAGLMQCLQKLLIPV